MFSNKNQTKYIAIFLFVLLSICGCTQKELPNRNAPELWIVTEKSCSDGMNLQAEIIAERMEEAYPGLTVRLDILSTEEAAREIYLKQLRTQIMSGSGPDLYLLPTGNYLSYDHSRYKARTMVTTSVEPLFYDVTQAMYSGVFLDIGKYYDTDESLEKEALRTEVMDAGVLDNSRYVLPLRFDMPVLLAGEPQTESFNILDLVSYALEQENRNMAIGIQLPNSLELFPQVFDYEVGKLLISAQDIANYMRIYQKWFAYTHKKANELLDDLIYTNTLRIPEDFRELELPQLDLGSFNSIRDYIFYETYWYILDFPIYASDLSDTLQSAAISKVIDHKLYMYPLKTTDGKTVAEVTYYGAVGSSCGHPELAYEFLSRMLSEEFQWEAYRPRGEKSYSFSEMLQYIEPQTHGFVENSFPVRSYGAVPKLWDILAYQEQGIYSTFLGGSVQNSRAFQSDSIYLEDADIPAIAFSIDEVRFSIVQPEAGSLSVALSQLNTEDGTPTEVDIDELAQIVYQNLWWHLAEG